MPPTLKAGALPLPLPNRPMLQARRQQMRFPQVQRPLLAVRLRLLQAPAVRRHALHHVRAIERLHLAFHLNRSNQ